MLYLKNIRQKYFYYSISHNNFPNYNNNINFKVGANMSFLEFSMADAPQLNFNLVQLKKL